jgi:hypothetical protein
MVITILASIFIGFGIGFISGSEWMKALIVKELPKRSPEFLKVYTANETEQRNFNLMQLKRDIATDAMNDILCDILGHPQSDKASQLFAILIKYLELLEHGIIIQSQGAKSK